MFLNLILILILIGKRMESDFKSGGKVIYDVAKGRVDSVSKEKSKTKELKGRNRDVKCWKCQGAGHVSKECANKKTMITLNGEIVND